MVSKETMRGSYGVVIRPGLYLARQMNTPVRRYGVVFIYLVRSTPYVLLLIITGMYLLLYGVIVYQYRNTKNGEMTRSLIRDIVCCRPILEKCRNDNTEH